MVVFLSQKVCEMLAPCKQLCSHYIHLEAKDSTLQLILYIQPEVYSKESADTVYHCSLRIVVDLVYLSYRCIMFQE